MIGETPYDPFGPPPEPPEVYPGPETQRPNVLPPDLPFTKEKRPPEWRWLGEPAPGSVPLPKDLSDIVLIRQIGAQLTTAADRQDSTATPARTEPVACASVTEFLDTFFSPGDLDVLLLCCPPREGTDEFEKKKTALIDACKETIAKWRKSCRQWGLPEALILKDVKEKIDETWRQLDKLHDEAIKQAGEDEEKRITTEKAWKKNKEAFEEDNLRTCIGIIAARLAGKTITYVSRETGKAKDLPGFPGFENPPKDKPCPRHPNGEPEDYKADSNRPQCPAYESPFVDVTSAGSETLDNLVTSIIDCAQPNAEWKIDCIRIATLSWIVAGYCLYGKEFLDKYPYRRVTFGPFSGKGDSDPRELDDLQVWPLGKDHIAQFGQDTDSEGRPIGPKQGDIVWFGHTATVCLGEINGVTRYLVPMGPAGTPVVLENKTEAEVEESWAMLGGVSPRPLRR
jgi:hypothetical protein